MTPPARGLGAVLAALPLDALHTDAVELADAVWLAQYLPRAEDVASNAEDDAVSEAADGARRRAEKAWLSLLGTTESADAEETVPEQDVPSTIEQSDGGEETVEESVEATREDFAVRVPYGPALPGQHRFLKALHDFRIAERTGPRTELDVRATIRDSAQAGCIVPRMRAPERLALSALCVLDSSRSMAVWQRAANEFARALKDSGLFREVDVAWIDGDGLEHTPRRSPAGPPDTRAVFLISDGVGAAWSGPELQGRLARWGRGGPLALLNPLPEHLWNRTALRPIHGNLRALRATPANTGMRVRAYARGGAAEFGPLPGTAAHRMPLPILEFEPERLAAWAGFVRQPSAAGFDCALAAPVLIGPDGDAEPGDSRRRAPRPSAPAEATARFLATASSTAVRLAEHLSALEGWMNLAIMRYIQEFAVPDSGPTPLAEVLLGGLMLEKAGGGRDPEEREYRFPAETRELLRRDLPFETRDRTLEFIAGGIGRAIHAARPGGGGGFTARAVVRAAGSDGGPGQAPFAEASLELARRLRVPEPQRPPSAPPTEADQLSARADAAHARFLASGRMEDLADAIGYRVTAVACSPDDQRAEMTLRAAREREYRWLYSRDPRDLAEAREYFAAARPGAAGEEPGTATEDVGGPASPLGNPTPPTEIRQARMFLQAFEDDPASAEKRAELALHRFNLAVALSGSAGSPEHGPAQAAEAIHLFQEALKMVTENDAPLASWNQVAAARALELARDAGRPEQLDWAVRLLRNTAGKAPSGDAEATTLLADLAAALHTRYGVRHEPADLAEAMRHLRTVTARPTGAPGALSAEKQVRCLLELGRVFEDRFELDHRLADLGEAAQAYLDAARTATADRPDLRAECLVALGSVFYRQGRDGEARQRLAEGVAQFERLGLGDHVSAVEARRLLTRLDEQLH